MIHAKIVLNGDGQFPELVGKTVHKGEIVAFTALPEGMESGRASVALVIQQKNGEMVFAETSLRMFHAAARAFAARYGEDL